MGRFRVTCVRVLGCSRLSFPGKSTTALTIKVNGREKQNQAAGAFLPFSRHEWRRAAGRRRREGARGRREPCLDAMDGRTAPGPVLFVFKTKLQGVFCENPWGRGGKRGTQGASGGPTTLLPSILLPGCSPSRQGWKTTPGCFLFTFGQNLCPAPPPRPPKPTPTREEQHYSALSIPSQTRPCTEVPGSRLAGREGSIPTHLV